MARRCIAPPAFFVHFTPNGIPATLEPARLHFTAGATVATLALVIAAAGYYLSRAGEPLFGKLVVED